MKIAVGTVHIKAHYNRTSFAQNIENDFTLKAQEKNVVKLLIESGRVIVDTAEEAGGPKVKSSVHIYPVVDGQPVLDDKIAVCADKK